MEKITPNKIAEILNQYYEEYKAGKRSARHFLFVGNTGIGKNSVIKKWFEEHHDIQDWYLPNSLSPLMNSDTSGRLVPVIQDGKQVYTFTDDLLQACSKKNVAMYIPRINYYTHNEFVFELKQILTNNTYKTCFGHEYDLSQSFGIIATAYPKNMGEESACFDEIKDLFEVYEVVPSVEEWGSYMSSFYEQILKSTDGEKLKND